MRTVEPSAVSAHESFDMEAARRAVVPAGVSFRIDGDAVVEGEYVRARGLLANATEVAQQVVVFPAGPFGFYVAPAPGAARARPPPPGTPPMPPPVPPPPLVIELPARTQVKLSSGFSLSGYEWIGPEPHALEWSFLFWNEPKPRGRLAIPRSAAPSSNGSSKP
jgi:hypothetical protein